MSWNQIILCIIIYKGKDVLRALYACTAAGSFAKMATEIAVGWRRHRCRFSGLLHATGAVAGSPWRFGR